MLYFQIEKVFYVNTYICIPCKIIFRLPNFLKSLHKLTSYRVIDSTVYPTNAFLSLIGGSLWLSCQALDLLSARCLTYTQGLGCDFYLRNVAMWLRVNQQFFPGFSCMAMTEPQIAEKVTIIKFPFHYHWASVTEGLMLPLNPLSARCLTFTQGLGCDFYLRNVAMWLRVNQ